MRKRTETVGLPPSDVVRWSPQRKAAVVEAVRVGAITLDEACHRYRLSAEELLTWQRAVEVDGVSALSVTRLQYYRDDAVSDGRASRASRGVIRR
jgi:transposase-like protein